MSAKWDLTDAIGNPDQTKHRLVAGDNLEVMEDLIEAQETFNVIYLDPPYNTGTYLTYQDTRSQWSCFMEPRIHQMRKLLADNGVLIMSIDDNELVAARTLLDSTFPNGYLGTAVWDTGATTSNARHISTCHDYLLFYAHNRKRIPKWKVPKPGIQELLDYAKTLVETSPTLEEAETAWRKHLRDIGAGKGLRQYGHLTGTGRVWREATLSSPASNRYQYDVEHPETGKVCRRPRRGWRCAEKSFWELDESGLIYWGEDETRVPQRIYYLDENSGQVPRSVFSSKAGAASRHVADLLGTDSSLFSYPKDHEVLARWFSMVGGKDARILDPFAGSGSTFEAVISLNERDGGTRTSTSITLNETDLNHEQAGVTEDQVEHGTFWDITVPRCISVLTGKRPDGSTCSEARSGYLEIFEAR